MGICWPILWTSLGEQEDSFRPQLNYIQLLLLIILHKLLSLACPLKDLVILCLFYRRDSFRPQLDYTQLLLLPFYISSFLWLVLLRTLSSYVCTSILKGQSPIGLVLLSFRFLVLYWLLRGPTPSSHYPACIKEYPSPYCLQGIIILYDYLTFLSPLIICALSYQEQT